MGGHAGGSGDAGSIAVTMGRTTAWHLSAILALYFALGAAFAALVPPWQAPDEPAHYNYTRQLALGRLPVIAMGDYDQRLIESEIAPPDKRPGVPLDAVQYEDHQPPLFYALSAPVFLLFNGSLLALRLWSLLIGGAAVAFGYAAAREVFPDRPGIAAAAAAMTALLPQHLHMLSSFNNDALAEALLALALWQCARLTREDGRAPAAVLAVLAVAVGLAFWTKATAYLSAPLAAFAVWRGGWASGGARRWSRALGFLAVAAVLGAPWWLRNVAVYGGTDVMGLQIHNAVVVGQPTTQEWLARFGPAGVLSRLAQTTFQSFWGQFGWMSVVLDARLYALMAAFTLASAGLFVLGWRTMNLTRRQRAQLGLFGLLTALAAAAFIWYNLQFVQHQGRYLYPALVPLATAASIGWHGLVARSPRLQPWLWVAFAVGFAALDAYLLWRVILPAMAG